MMKVSGKVRGSVVDGPGYNYVIFMQGCSHHCKECHNKSTWDFKGGFEVDVEDLHHEITSDIYTGVTFSGGDPMDVILRMKKGEFDRFIVFVKDLKTYGLNIISYSGYYKDELTNERQLAFLELIDILIDGPFEIDKKMELPFRGSSNQNVIALTKTGEILLEKSRRK